MLATFIQAMGINGKVLQFLRANDEYNERTERITSHIQISSSHHFPIDSVHSSFFAVTVPHQITFAAPFLSKFPQDHFHYRTISCGGEISCMQHSYRQCV
jgi:hypothetical protein